MDRLKIARLGGFAGFGLPGSHLKSRGEVTLSELSPTDRKAVDSLFENSSKRGSATPDAFRYRLTRQTANGPESIEVFDDHLPAVIKNSVKDELE